MAKTALVTGIRGQDGTYLGKFLLEKGYRVWGADRRSGDATHWRAKRLGIESDIHHMYMDLLEYSNVLRTLDRVQPDEIYNLAAQSFVSASFEQPIVTTTINAIGVLHLLESIRTVNPKIRFYQASTSEMFGKAQQTPQSETTPFHPRSPYGVSKVFGHWITVNYRESYGTFACCGILFNHESPLRGEEFVTRKISLAASRISRGKQDKVVLGNLDAKRDWGYAAEFVEGMWLMLQQNQADDYVLATGESHSIREFADLAFSKVGIPLQWHGDAMEARGIDSSGVVRVEVSPDYYRPAEVDALKGDATKARERLGWKPRTTFQNLVELMVESDLQYDSVV
ncbi:MAG: GDP-mannose 4,6-dehydratase [Deltaproteobacteria bacterium]|nr:GDP-mannose 4,6-dehydratase [Deltaproteobacteria bacterium]